MSQNFLEAKCLLESKMNEKIHGEIANLNHLEQISIDFINQMESELSKQTQLIVHFKTLSSRVNAEVIKVDDEIKIELMGGILRHQLMNPKTLKLLLCHEIGHVLGGEPKMSRGGWSSTEGQADYYSSHECAKRLDFDEESFLQAAQDLTGIYAEVRGDKPPRIENCDEHVAPRTNYGYPTLQCRMDTLLNGWYGLERPKCWYRN